MMRGMLLMIPSGVSGFVSANPREPVPLPAEEINRYLRKC